MKKYILFTAIAFFCLGLSAKDLKRVIRWKTVGSENFVSFEGASVNGKNLPVYTETIPLKKGEEILISNLAFESCDGSSLEDVKRWISSELEIEPKYIHSESKIFGLINFVPLINDKGEFKKLVSFDVGIVKNAEKKSLAIKANQEWASASVLSAGKWVKIKTTERGVHKIPYNLLSNWGFSNPSEVNLYGNGGYMLPKMNDDFFYDDLQQNSVWHGKDENNNDCIFFYSTGTVRWKWDEIDEIFRHERNDYSDDVYYYLSDQGTAKTVEDLPEESGSVTHTVTSFNDYTFHEEEKENLIKSGRRWFGERFIRGQNQTFQFSLDNLATNEAVKIWIEGAARSSATSAFDVNIGNNNVGKINFGSVKTSIAESLYASVQSKIFSIDDLQANFNIKLNYQGANSSSDAWLDFILVNFIREPTLDNQVAFRDVESLGSGNVADYRISITNDNVQIWDVTDYLNPKSVFKNIQNGEAGFKASSASLREYVAFYPDGDIPEPELVGDVGNQNLHGDELAEMIIISHPDFIAQADELARFHQQVDGMAVQIVEPSTIYNEFSSGMPDVSGIRNYLRMCYDRSKTSGSTKLKYVLFFGDGSYDNKDILGHGNNFLPTYQSENSLLPVASFITDDFFVLLDEGEGEYIGLIDLGVGRIPAKTTQEAQTVINKIKNYVDTVSLGNWRNVVCFIGDDEDSNAHMIQAESMANGVNADNPAFFTDKIYFDAYLEESGPGGERYPDVNDAINNRVKNGALILNYTGHANESAMADEKVLGLNDIDSWSNYNKLPIFVTATCEISRFDTDENSAGEHILFNPNGGGIGLFTTTRLVYSEPNFRLNKEFYEHVFSKDENGENLRMGDIMRRSKNGINTGNNKRNFTLLADPALKLSYPKFKVITETINGKPVGEQTETISSLSTVTVKGRVADHLGNVLDDFNGELVPVVYDKVETVETLGNGNENPMTFKVQNNIIYKGVATVTNGNFEFTFIVPKDISYSVAPGKIIYYADDGENDAQGYTADFNIGGSSGIVINDNEGPEVKIYLNDESFKDGDEVGKNPILFAEIEDEHGINTVGTGIGHDITATIDGNIIVLNDFYLAEKDSYQKGKVIFPLRNLSVGEHTLRFKVWDVLNNSSEVEIMFTITGDLQITDVWCYPNPVTDATNFKFKHNRPDESFETRVEIFDLTGSIMDVITQRLGSGGNESFSMFWKVNNSTMLYRSGAYLYRITIDADDGASTSKTGRMIISKY